MDPFGWILGTTVAVALHEIPRAISDFGVPIYGGSGRRRALVLDCPAQATVVVGGVAGSPWTAMEPTLLVLLDQH